MAAELGSLKELIAEGDGLLEGGSALAALGRYEDAAAVDPNCAEAHSRRALALWALDRQAEATEAFGMAADLEPAVASHHNNYGVALHTLLRFDAALLAFDKAIELDPMASEPHNNRGNSLMSADRCSHALAAFDRSLELNPYAPTTHANRAHALVRLDRFEEAIVACGFAVELDPDLAEAYGHCGDALRHLGRFEHALEACDIAIRLNPGLAESHSVRARSLWSLGRVDDALVAAERAIALDPQCADAHYAKGCLLKNQEFYDEAQRAFDDAIRAAPQFADAHSERAYNLRGLGRYREALDGFRDALELDAGLTDAHRGKGNTFLNLDRPGEALSAYEAALAIDPQLASAHMGRGNALTWLDRFREALEAFRESAALDGSAENLAMLYNNLGLLFWGAAKKGELPWAGPTLAVACCSRVVSSGGLLHPAVCLHLLRSGEAPMLARRAARQQAIEGLSTWSRAYIETEQACTAPLAAARALLRNDEYPPYQRVLLAATLHLHWGDAGTAMKLLDDAEDDSEQCGAAPYQFYLSLAASRTLHEEAASIWEYATKVCEAVIDEPDAAGDDLYYAALHLLEGPPLRVFEPTPDVPMATIQRALQAIDRSLEVAPDAQHCVVLRCYCLKRLGREDEFKSVAKQAVELEGRSGLLGHASLEAMPVAWSDVARVLRHLAHRVELAVATQAVLGALPDLRVELGIKDDPLDVPDYHAVHVPAVLRIGDELAAWIFQDNEREAKAIVRSIQNEHPSSTAELDRRYRDVVSVGRESIEAWMGEQLKQPEFKTDFSALCQYAFLRGYVTAQEAVMLRFFETYPLGSPLSAKRFRRTASLAAITGSILALASGSAPAGAATTVSALGLTSALLGAAAELVQTPVEITYDDFRADFYRWASAERDRLGATEFDKRYRADGWMPALFEPQAS